MVRENLIKEIKDWDLKVLIALEKFPEIGFVGKFVIDQIIKQSDIIKFVELKSDYFPTSNYERRWSDRAYEEWILLFELFLWR